jgi:5'-nucleotidase
MKLLLSNDDGIDAPGLAALLAAAREFGEPVVVAPRGRSRASAMLLLLKALSAGRAQPDSFCVARDTSRLRAARAAPRGTRREVGFERRQSWANLGADVYYSGTVAAVREAVLHGWPGIALSHYRRESLAEYDWRAAAMGRGAFSPNYSTPIEPGLFFNVNFPHLAADAPEPRIVFCRSIRIRSAQLPPRRKRPALLRWDYHSRERTSGADVDVCFGGNIAVTEIRLF